MHTIIIDLAISLVLPHLGNKSKKFDFVHETISCWEVHVSWARDQHRPMCNVEILDRAQIGQDVYIEYAHTIYT